MSLPQRFLVLLLFWPLAVQGQLPDTTFFRGVDLSTVPQIAGVGGKYFAGGTERNVLDLLRENGANCVRLRLWHTPVNGICGLDSTLVFARAISSRGLKFLLDIHYSDTWADPGKQAKPAAWSALSFTVLKESVYSYTRNVLSALAAQHTVPELVQIGNEITPGMLFPDGKVSGAANPSLAWSQFGALLKEGVRGARDGAADSSLKIMIHIDRGGDNATSRWFYDNLQVQGVPFDVIGLSYYPWWHGSFSQLATNLNDLATRYGKKIVVAETGYPWTTQWVNDGVGNIGINASTLPAGYTSTAQGQKAFLTKVRQILKAVPNGKGGGFFYWEPAYISVPPVGSAWEHVAMFDFGGQALSSLTAFMDFDTIPTVNVRVRINTATHNDTLKSTGMVQLRGEVKGRGSNLLPGGQLATGDQLSGLVAQNSGGDYWETALKMYVGDRLEFKLWTGHSVSVPTSLRLGWEGIVTPFDGTGLPVRAIVAGTADTTLPVEYYNAGPTAVAQYWSPFAPNADSIGVLFRVNMLDLLTSGAFNPATQGPVVVRGDSLASAGVLAWSAGHVVLVRESTSVANGSFWSGIARFPRSAIAAGTPIAYAFFVERSPFGGSENRIGSRSFLFPSADTTLAWRFFNERQPLTGVDEGTSPIPTEPVLYPNYPNPFNPNSDIRIQISEFSMVRLAVYDLLGREVAVLVNETKVPGSYTVRFDGARLSSGTYMCRLSVGDRVESRRMLLLR